MLDQYSELSRKLGEENKLLKLQNVELTRSHDLLTLLAERVWCSKTLFEAHQHFVAWRDKTGEFVLNPKGPHGEGKPCLGPGCPFCDDDEDKPTDNSKAEVRDSVCCSCGTHVPLNLPCPNCGTGGRTDKSKDDTKNNYFCLNEKCGWRAMNESRPLSRGTQVGCPVCNGMADFKLNLRPKRLKFPPMCSPGCPSDCDGHGEKPKDVIDTCGQVRGGPVTFCSTFAANAEMHVGTCIFAEKVEGQGGTNWSMEKCIRCGSPKRIGLMCACTML
jgi:hypothetical protein